MLGQPSPTAVLEVGASSSFPALPHLPGAAQAACAGDAAAQPGLAIASVLSDASSHSSGGSRLMPIHKVRVPPHSCTGSGALNVRFCNALTDQPVCPSGWPQLVGDFGHVACTACVR